MDDKKSFWSEAGRDGAVLGGVSIAYMLVTWGLGLLEPDTKIVNILVSVAGILLWVAKFVLCITLMKRFVTGFSSREGRPGFGFGAAVAFLSALVYSAFTLAYFLYINPEYFAASFEMLAASGAYDRVMLSQIEEVMPKLPVYSFFLNLVYCTLFGTILSAIFSERQNRSNPFEQ